MLEFQSLVDEFNAAHPDIEIVQTKVDGSDLTAKLQSLPVEQLPDIVITEPAALKFLVESGLVIAPGECPDIPVTDLLPVVKATYSLAGQLEATPYGVSTPVLMFDAAEVRRAGLDPAHPPKTLDELRAASKQVVDSGVSPYGFVAFDDDGGFLINEGNAQSETLIASPANGHDGDDMTVRLHTPANVAAMQWLVDVVKTGGGVWIGGDPSAQEDLVKIVDPKEGGVFSFHTSASIGDILQAMQAGSFLPGVELGVGPMPGPGVAGTVGGNAMFLLDHGSSNRAAAAATVVAWLSASDKMAAFDAATGYVPPSQSVADDPAIVSAYAQFPQLRVAFDQLSASSGNDAAAGTAFGPGRQIDDSMQDMTTKIIADGLDPATALSQTSAIINTLLSTYADQAPAP